MPESCGAESASIRGIRVPMAWRRAAAAALIAVSAACSASAADAPGPFEKYAGRWVGEGRLGIRDAATEQVKCRVTYTPSDNGHGLHQSIRCASQGGSMDVRTDAKHADGALSGTWKELTRDWSGTLTGKVSDKAIRVRVAGDSFNAHMSIELKGEKQIIEIQFMDSALIGLTLWLTQG